MHYKYKLLDLFISLSENIHSCARLVQGLALGRDQSRVKMSGKVASIGLEDRFMGIHDREGVRYMGQYSSRNSTHKPQFCYMLQKVWEL